MTFIPFTPSASGNSSLQNLTIPFTAPPAASNWSLAATGTGGGGGGGGDAPINVSGGVFFNSTNGNNISVTTKNLAVPGGAHVVTMFLVPQIIPADNLDSRAYTAVHVMGTTQFAEIKLAFSGDGLGVYMIGSLRSNTAYFTASNINFPWALYKGGYPYAAAWYRLTFDNTNLSVDRFQIGSGNVFPSSAVSGSGTWETIWPSQAHSCGAIQKVGVVTRSSLTVASGPVGLTLLSYTET